MKEVRAYLTSWLNFRNQCEEKIKGRCHINNKGWVKLRDYHMEQWLKSHKAPFGFMFKLKHQYYEVYKTIPCAPKWYHVTRLQRQVKFEMNVARKFVEFPSWRGFFRSVGEEE